MLVSVDRNTSDTASVLADVRSLFMQAGEIRDKNREEARLLEATSLPQQTPWLNRMKWLEIFRDQDLKSISTASAMPKRGDIQMQGVVNGVHFALVRCLTTLANTDTRTRQWWRSPKSDVYSMRPMTKLATPAGWNRYVSYWQRFVVFCLRVTQRTDYTIDFNVKFDDTQLLLLDSIRECSQKITQDISMSALMDRAKRDKDILHIKRIADLIQDLAAAVLKRYIRDRIYDNSLIFFTAVLGIHETEFRFKEPRMYTN